MRLIKATGDKRVVTEGGYMLVQERHAGDWWTGLRIELKVLAEAYHEYVDFLMEDEETSTDEP